MGVWWESDRAQGGPQGMSPEHQENWHYHCLKSSDYREQVWVDWGLVVDTSCLSCLVDMQVEVLGWW